MPPSSSGALVDSVEVLVRAGAGGRGAVSFRREPFVPRGGPDGADGGRGGSVVLHADPALSSLQDFARRRTLRAPNGQPGRGAFKTGRAGPDLHLQVPVGTIVFDAETGAVLGDLDRPGAELVVARGGNGGRGNVQFKSSVNRSPHIAEPGQPGEELRARLELKLIADVGIVGLPNAGKSSLLRAMSAATPRVGDYPFTTLEPQLAVVELPRAGRFVVADVPGLVEGAARGAGLGQRFLRHIERTRVLLYLVDGAGDDPWADLETVRGEVRAYGAGLAQRPSLVAVNKVDLPAARARQAERPAGDALWLSAETGEGVPELIAALAARVAESPVPTVAAPPPEARPVRLPRQEGPPQVIRHRWGFEVRGPAIERVVARTDFGSEQSLDRFQVLLDRIGVSAALAEAGAQPGDTVRVGDLEFEYQPG
jgi:GTPase